MAGRLIAVILEKSLPHIPPSATARYLSVRVGKRSKLGARLSHSGGIGRSESGNHQSFFNHFHWHARLTKILVMVRVPAFRDGLELRLRQKDETAWQETRPGRPVLTI
jgi:hypothetical protein